MPDSEFTIRAAMDATDAIRKSDQLDKKLGDVRKTTQSTGQSAKETGKAFGDFLGISTSRVDGFATALTKIGAGGIALGAIAALGAAAFKVGQEFEQATKIIRTGTGATGESLKGLETSLRNVASSADESIGDIAQVIADLNTRTGQTGPTLEKLASQILDLSDVTGTNLQANVAAVTRVFGDWSISTSRQSDALDFLFKVSQSTDIEVTKLANTVVQFGAPLRQLGFDFEQSAALIGKFEKEGVNVETVMSGLRIGLANLAKAGVDGKQGMELAVEGIKNAGSTAEANTAAIAIFGQRAGPDMAAAIREGRFEIDEMVTALKNSDETINGAAEASKTLGDRWGELLNNVKLLLEPLGTALVAALNAVLKAINEIAGPAIRGLLDGFNAIKTAFFDSADEASRFGDETGKLPQKFNDAREAGRKAFDAYKELEERTKGAAEGTRELTKEQEELVGAFNKIDIRKIKDFNEAFGLADKLGKAADFIDDFNKNVRVSGEVTAKSGPQLKNLGDLMDRINNSSSEAGENVKNFGAFMKAVNQIADETARDWGRAQQVQAQTTATVADLEVKIEDLNETLRRQRSEMTASEKATKEFSERLFGLAIATTDLGTTMGKFGREGLEQLAKLPPGFDKIKQAARGTRDPIQQVSTAITDLGKSIADIILEGGKLSDVFVNFGKTILRILTENLIGRLIGQLGQLIGMIPGLSGIGGIFGGTAGRAGGSAVGIGGLAGFGGPLGIGLGTGLLAGTAAGGGAFGIASGIGAGAFGIGAAAGIAGGAGIGALSPLAALGPVGLALFGGAIAVTGIAKLLSKSVAEKFSQEFARDFGNVRIPDDAVRQFISGLGISEKALEPIRKDIASSPLFLQIGFQAAEAQGKVESFLQSLEGVGTVFGTGDFRAAFEFGQLTGDFSALNAQFTELFSNSTELVKLFGQDLKPLLIDMGAGFEPLTGRIQEMIDAGASLEEVFAQLGPEIVLFLAAAQQTGLTLDPLITQFGDLAAATEGFTDRQIALYLALRTLQQVPAQVSEALGKLNSDIEFLISIGASSDEIITLLGGSIENLVEQADKLGIEIPETVRNFYDMKKSAEVATDALDDFSEAARGVAGSLGLAGDAAVSFATGFDSVFTSVDDAISSADNLAGRFNGLIALMSGNGIDALTASERAWDRLGTQIVNAYNDLVLLGIAIPPALQSVIDFGVAAGLIRLDVNGLAQSVETLTKNLRVYNGVWSEVKTNVSTDAFGTPLGDPFGVVGERPPAPTPPIYNPANPFNVFGQSPTGPPPSTTVPGTNPRTRGTPVFASGGIMPWDGYAWLEGGERVLTPAQSRAYQVNNNGGNRVNVNVTVNAGASSNPHEIGRAVAREVSRQVQDSLNLNRAGLRSKVRGVR